MSDIIDWFYQPWEYCWCGDLLVVHWRGRPCLEPPVLIRDESTPDRREIWNYVERAASRTNTARL